MKNLAIGLFASILTLPLAASAAHQSSGTAEASKPLQLAEFIRVHEGATSGYRRIWNEPSRYTHSYSRSNYNDNTADGGYDRGYYQRPKLSVCFDNRQDYTDRRGVEYFRYMGCVRQSASCERTGKQHFGRYTSERSAIAALRRCMAGRPDLERSPLQPNRPWGE